MAAPTYNLSWQQLKPVILPEPDPVPAAPAPPPPPPIHVSTQLNVLDPAPVRADLPDPVVAEADNPLPDPAPNAAAAKPKKAAAKRPSGHVHLHRYAGVVAKTGARAKTQVNAVGGH
jgi:hypothetical protein